MTAALHRTVDDLLVEARNRLRRVTPREAASAAAQGALLVDIRPDAQRRIEGEIPGALIIERNVLEWRLDPCSRARLDGARDHDLRVIVFCSEGYTSSLAAASLQDIGMQHATDIVGGFRSWLATGLPTAPGGTPAGETTPGRPGRWSGLTDPVRC